jgi:hypothetical protein
LNVTHYQSSLEWALRLSDIIKAYLGVTTGYAERPEGRNYNMVEEQKYEVVRPVSERNVAMITMAPRLDTLEGKTVCELWNESFKANITFPVIRELLKKNYPGINVIPYTEMPIHHMMEDPGIANEASEALIAALKEKGCDAVISGNAG